MTIVWHPAVSFLIPTSKSLTRSIDYQEARRIVEKLGCLPLAIDQAGSYLSMLQKPIQAFLPLFEENFNKTLSKKPPSAVWQYGEETVVTTWEISFKAIQEMDPQAAILLLLCSFLANDDIGVDFLCRGLPTQFLGGGCSEQHLWLVALLIGYKYLILTTIYLPCSRSL